MEGYFTVPKIVWGSAAIEQLSGLEAHRALLVVDPALSRENRHRRIVEEFAKTDTVVEVVDSIAVEPTVASVGPVADRIRGFGPDWIVAVGGGSTIDTARGAWAAAARPDLPLESLSPLAALDARRVARFVAIPTTSGSGSDASWTAHLRQPDGRLLELGNRDLLPDWSLLDPSLPRSAPPAAAANGVAEIFAHSLEALLSEWASPFSDAVARAALGIAVEAVPKLGRAPDDERRAGLQYAATLAGAAAANASGGVAHALAHAIGGSVPIPHGRLVAAVLPFSLEFNYPVAKDRFLSLGSIFGGGPVQNRSGIAEWLRAQYASLALPRTLADAGISAEVLAQSRGLIVARAGAAPEALANPRVPSATELERLLDAAFAGRPVDF